MRINDPTITSAGISVTTTSGTSGTAATSAAGRGASTNRTGGTGTDDSVQLSNLASGLESLRSDSAARLEKVEQLSQVVAAGQYQPDAQAIASSLVTEALGG